MITQNLNPKSNIRKTTNSDLPYNLNQPVIASYYATSTASQTVINLPFTIDTTSSGYTDNFWLFVDGKKLRLGSGNDYTFTSVAPDGTSSQVTLAYSIVANLNIQAYKLGLKPESQFGMDNRFVQMYNATDAGFQAFVDSTSSLITATTTTGAPAAGRFYSSIVNRASMPDLSQDLKARMGIERIITQQIYEIQNEFGPNGERVFGALNDSNGQIRFVGNWINLVDNDGQSAYTVNTTDYIEIVFYGTGLNLLCRASTASLDMRASVDGGSEGSNIFGGVTFNSVLSSRNYSSNQVVAVASGLALGIHTVKIRNNQSSQNQKIYGFEILNESSLVKVAPGSAYLKNQQYAAPALQSFSYSAPVTGTNGGRVLTYLKSDGTIGQSWQAVDASPAYLSSANHTNEEIARVYHWREFGAGRTDDLSTFIGSNATAGFVLDDGTTTMVGSGISINTTNNIIYYAASGSIVTFTFVGTGLDVIRQDTASTSGTDTFTVYVDGASVGTVSGTGSTTKRNFKIVSGLPYGTHTVRITRSSAPNTWDFTAVQYIVYQPKKPSLPSGAIELADYNVLANFAAVTGTGAINHDEKPKGTLHKQSEREYTYVGTSWAQTSNGNAPGWIYTRTTNNSDYVQYTFFGTGFVTHMVSDSATFDYSVTIDGSLNASGVADANASNLGGGSYRCTDTNTDRPSRVRFTGLSLGMHTVRITKTAGTNMRFGALDIITPIHSYRSSLYADLQNTLPVGSQGISDNRKLTPLEEVPTSQKYRGVALAVTSTPPSTTANSPVPLADMSLTVQSSGSWFAISYSNRFTSSSSATGWMGVFVNGSYAISQLAADSPGSFGGLTDYTISNTITVYLPRGTHKVDVYWAAGSGATLSAVGLRRMLTAVEL